MTVRIGGKVVEHPPQEPSLSAWANRTRERLLRRGKLVPLHVLAAICEPMTRLGLVKSLNRPGILMYHRVSPEVPDTAPLTWNVTPDRFRDQLLGLLQLGYEAWSLKRLLNALAEGRDLPRRAFVVTFDDGYANNHDYAWPILRELSIPATIFLATHYLDREEPFPFDDWRDKGKPGVPADRWRPLSRSQVDAMMNDPLIEFGCHTHLHRDYRDDPAAFANDLTASFAFLRTELGIEAPTFAFPFGLTNKEMLNVVRASGARCAVTTEATLTDASADPFLLGRFGVDEHESSKTLSFKLDGWYGWLKRRPSAPMVTRYGWAL